MGMFDTIKFHKNCAPTCLEGHTISSFQTKDLECSLATYLVYEGKLYLKQRTSELDDSFGYSKVEISKNYNLLLHATDIATEIKLTSELRIYTACHQCRPILIAGASWSLDRIREEYVWVEFNAKFNNGEVEKLQAVSENREALRNKLKAQGALLIEDDHPIAVAHFYKLENHKGEVRG